MDVLEEKQWTFFRSRMTPYLASINQNISISLHCVLVIEAVLMPKSRPSHRVMMTGKHSSWHFMSLVGDGFGNWVCLESCGIMCGSENECLLESNTFAQIQPTKSRLHYVDSKLFLLLTSLFDQNSVIFVVC